MGLHENILPFNPTLLCRNHFSLRYTPKSNFQTHPNRWSTEKKKRHLDTPLIDLEGILEILSVLPGRKTGGLHPIDFMCKWVQLVGGLNLPLQIYGNMKHVPNHQPGKGMYLDSTKIRMDMISATSGYYTMRPFHRRIKHFIEFRDHNKSTLKCRK